MRFRECLRGVLVPGHGMPWVSGSRFVRPVYPFGRVEPPVTQLDEASRSLGDGDRSRVGRVARGRARSGSGRPGTGMFRTSCSACSAVGPPGWFRAGATRARGTGCAECRTSRRRRARRRSSWWSGQIRASYQRNARYRRSASLRRFIRAARDREVSARSSSASARASPGSWVGTDRTIRYVYRPIVTTQPRRSKEPPRACTEQDPTNPIGPAGSLPTRATSGSDSSPRSVRGPSAGESHVWL